MIYRLYQDIEAKSRGYIWLICIEDKNGDGRFVYGTIIIAKSQIDQEILYLPDYENTYRDIIRDTTRDYRKRKLMRALHENI